MSGNDIDYGDGDDDQKEEQQDYVDIEPDEIKEDMANADHERISGMNIDIPKQIAAIANEKAGTGNSNNFLNAALRIPSLDTKNPSALYYSFICLKQTNKGYEIDAKALDREKHNLENSTSSRILLDRKRTLIKYCRLWIKVLSKLDDDDEEV